jgi:large repetitive protein
MGRSTQRWSLSRRVRCDPWQVRHRTLSVWGRTRKSRRPPLRPPHVRLFVGFAVAIATLTAPTLAVAKPDAKTTSTDASFRFTANVDDARFECALDHAPFARCEPPTRYTGLTAGEHEFRVRAIDQAGNVDPTPASYRWTIEQRDCESASVSASAAELAEFPGPSWPTDCAVQPAPGDESRTKREPGPSDEPAQTKPPLEPKPPLEENDVRTAPRDQGSHVDDPPASRVEAVEEPTPTCSEPPHTATADRDAWVLQSSPSDNRGADSVLEVHSKDGADARALVGFRLPGMPAGCDVKSATLRLYSGSFTEGRTLEALGVAASWTEGGVEWGNQPATAGIPATARTPSGAGYLEWNVTVPVESMFEGSNHGFLIRDSAEGGGGVGQSFSSRENGSAEPPELLIVFG